MRRSPIALFRCSLALFASSAVSSLSPPLAATFVTRAPLISSTTAAGSTRRSGGVKAGGAGVTIAGAGGMGGGAGTSGATGAPIPTSVGPLKGVELGMGGV